MSNGSRISHEWLGGRSCSGNFAFEFDFNFELRWIRPLTENCRLSYVDASIEPLPDKQIQRCRWNWGDERTSECRFYWQFSRVQTSAFCHVWQFDWLDSVSNSKFIILSDANFLEMESFLFLGTSKRLWNGHFHFKYLFKILANNCLKQAFIYSTKYFIFSPPEHARIFSWFILKFYRFKFRLHEFNLHAE